MSTGSFGFTQTPRALFDSFYRSADVLLRVYRLLRAENEMSSPEELLERIRKAIDADPDEFMFFLVNELFVGVVREAAYLPNTFFRHGNMALLLRQAVVAACTAMDVYYPAVLRRHLPTVVEVKHGDFVPNDKSMDEFLKDVRFTVLDHLRIVQDWDSRYDELARAMLDKLGKTTMSNVSGITAVMRLLGYDKPWETIAQHLGRKENDVRTAIEALVNRRNDIVHRGDRRYPTDEQPRAIDYAWTHDHVATAASVVHACDELVNRRMAEYREMLAATDMTNQDEITEVGLVTVAEE